MGKIVGLDIGESSVKMAYFSGRELKKAVSADLPDAMVSGGRILSMDAMADFLKETAKKNGIPLTAAATTLPTAEIFTREITMPAMTEQQLSYNLPYEFRDFLTEEKNKYFFDYAVHGIERDENGEPREMRIFACAMLKSAVEDYRAMFRRAGFKLKVLTPAECAYESLIAGLEKRAGDPGADRCIVNMGHQLTRLYLFHGGLNDGLREIEMGLAQLDELIAERFGVDTHVAHSYKESNYNGVLESDYAREFYNRLAVEVMKAVNFYHYNNRERQLTELYLCGGGCAIAPLRESIAELTKLPTFSGEALLPESARPKEAPWLYLRAIGGVSEGIKGGLA